MTKPASIVVLISGRGSNLRSIVAAHPGRVLAVISNKREAAGLEFAAEQGIDTAVVDHTQFPSREAFDEALAKVIDSYAPSLVVLAGFMRVLTAGFVARYEGRLMNIHPSLLPAYPGLHTHRRALEEGVRIHGCTVHFVTSDLDHGPIVIQAAVPVRDDDTESTLSARVLEAEHRIYPAAIRWFLAGSIQLVAGKVVHADPPPLPGALIWPDCES
ncbi:MAG: hypothetical protein RIR70_1797 [Pseudomonadota bacterium]|jgi:phosphoribosylglycinamide formyltransferase-1